MIAPQQASQLARHCSSNLPCLTSAGGGVAFRSVLLASQNSISTMVNRHQFQQLAKAFRAGKLTLEEFSQQGFNATVRAEASSDVQSTKDLATLSVDVDLDRPRRCGWPEVILGEGKTPEQVLSIAHAITDADQPLLITRINQDVATALNREFPEGLYHAAARTFRFGRKKEVCSPGSTVAVVSAGTSDRAVAAEASETLRWMGIAPVECADAGVAGPARLEKHLPALRKCRSIVVVAGMEGALPSVVAGHVGCPVFAVPTSVGYGANLGGIAALLSMLNSCAANVAVVNIDAGFKAGYLAGMVACQAECGMRNAE